MTTPPDFIEFVTAAQPRLIHFADLLTGDRGRAEDLVQTALERVYLRWSKLRLGNPEAYARTTITHAAVDWWRRRPSSEQPTDLTDYDGSAAGDFAIALAERDAVMKALKALTRRERAVVVLRYFYDLSEADIAAEIGCAPGTVKSASARALTKLKYDRNLTREVIR